MSAEAALDAIEKQITERWRQADRDHSDCIMASQKSELAGRARAYHIAWTIIKNEKTKAEARSLAAMERMPETSELLPVVDNSADGYILGGD